MAKKRARCWWCHKKTPTAELVKDPIDVGLFCRSCWGELGMKSRRSPLPQEVKEAEKFFSQLVLIEEV